MKIILDFFENLTAVIKYSNRWAFERTLIDYNIN